MLKSVVGCFTIRQPILKLRGRLKTHWWAVVSLAVMLAVFVLCAASPLFTRYEANAQDLEHSLAPPSPAHILGADRMGRDLYTRLLYGGRVTLLSALSVVLISALVGVPLGLIAAYRGGKLETAVMRGCDVVLSFPSLLLAFIFVAIFGRGIEKAVVALGLIYVPMLCRLVRSLTLVEKNKTYIEASRSIGFGAARIIFRHILPNCYATIIVQLAIDLGYAILDLAALSFLGLGVSPPTADWGAMLDEGRGFLLQAPLLALAPGAAIVITVVSINSFCDSAMEALHTRRAS